MEIYKVNLRIQSEYRKIRTRNNSVFGHFSRSGMHPSYVAARHTIQIKNIQNMAKIIKNYVNTQYPNEKQTH